MTWRVCVFGQMISSMMFAIVGQLHYTLLILLIPFAITSTTVWDDNIIETAEERFYDSNRGDYIDAIQQNITKAWADQVEGWENCSPNEIPCPDIYASESIEAACQMHKGVTENAVLKDDYFFSRLPVVTLRLAEAGVRLAASLNRIFGKQYASAM